MADLKTVERLEVITLMDNYTDVLIPSNQTVRRSPHFKNGTIAPPLIAEHGLSLLIRVYGNGDPHSFLLDAGWSATGLLHNMKELEEDPDEIEGIILSHGHMDHHGALKEFLGLQSAPVPVIVHPDVFLKNRFLIFPDGKKIYLPVLDEESLIKTGAQIIKNKSSYFLASNFILVTGEIERITDFEKGLPNAYMEKDGIIERDFILDDQAIITHLKGKGLVVITGCAHSGIINTVRYAQKITGIDSVYAVIGGFHLGGPQFESIIPPTIEEMKKINPSIISPMHCTGFKATTEIAKNMPHQFVLSSVGTTLIFSV